MIQISILLTVISLPVNIISVHYFNKILNAQALEILVTEKVPKRLGFLFALSLTSKIGFYAGIILLSATLLSRVL